MLTIKNNDNNFVIKLEYFTGRKTGFLKTETEKFYLGSDGVLSLVPLGSKESAFSGIFKNNKLQYIPEEYFLRVQKSLNKLVCMYKALANNNL